MDRNDWVDLLVVTYDGPDGPYAANTARTVLDAHVLAACPDCKVTGVIMERRFNGGAGGTFEADCTHPNAPTVEQVLTVGLRTLSAEYDERMGDWTIPDGKGSHRIVVAAGLLRALRGENA